MNHRPPPLRSEPEIDRFISSATGPAFVLAMRAARLDLANDAGRAWLRTPASTSLASASLADPEADTEAALPELAAIDPGMPALLRLRELSDSLGPGTRCSVTLTFLTVRGERTAVCDVAFVDFGNDILALVEVGPDKPLAAAHTAPGPPARERPQPSPVPSPGDAAILKEIARRIREGQILREGQSLRDRQSLHGDQSLRAQPPTDPAAPPPAPEAEQQSIRIAKLAHELKTPLSAIVAAAEIMRDERFGPIENPRYRSYASDIFDSARHALMVIGNMLGDASAGIEFDHGSSLPAMVFTEVDLNAVAESCVSSMLPLADAAGLSLSATLGEGLPHVVADATAIRQIVLNLLNNAVKFTAPGGEIRLVTRHDCDGHLELVVRDTGRGMTAEEIAKAGAPHLQVALSRREGGGLGIGLPLVGALARANGAGIAFASEPSRGTAVTVSFARDRVVPV